MRAALALALTLTISCGARSGLEIGEAPGDVGPKDTASPDAPDGIGPERTPLVVAGGTHACLRATDGTVRCWGDNRLGQLGDGTFDQRTSVATVKGVDDVDDLSANACYTCAKRADRTLWCWGCNDRGQLADRSGNKASPTKLLDSVAQLPVGALGDVAAVVTVDGTAITWGADSVGATCDGRIGDFLPIASAPSLNGALEISHGQFVTCARMASNELRCCGANNFGQLDDGTKAPNSLLPVNISVANVIQGTAGAGHACALVRDGTARCWGSNSNGALGDGTTTKVGEFQRTPVIVKGLGEIVRIIAGFGSTCALTRGGTVFCWGLNQFGEVGDGTTTNRALPTMVPALTDVVQIAMGSQFTVARTRDGRVLCWGRSDLGQCGVVTKSQPVPKIVPLN
jgi:alpha-tubulin suppressor-like RCC1 family protein